MTNPVQLEVDYEFRELIHDATQNAQVSGQINVVIARWQTREIDTFHSFSSIEAAYSFVSKYDSDTTDTYIIGGDVLDG